MVQPEISTEMDMKRFLFVPQAMTILKMQRVKYLFTMGPKPLTAQLIGLPKEILLLLTWGNQQQVPVMLMGTVMMTSSLLTPVTRHMSITDHPQDLALMEHRATMTGKPLGLASQSQSAMQEM